MGNSQTNRSGKATKIIGIVLCVIFGIMLICNLTIIIQGVIDPNEPPSLFGVTPLVVLSGSMSGDAEDHVELGDLIFSKKTDPASLNVGDVISYTEPGSSAVTTHRIIEVKKGDDGKILWRTKGDANNVEDMALVSEDNLVGVYVTRIPKLGNFAIFLQKPLGMIIFIGVPVLAFIIYDIIRRQRASSRNNEKTAELEAELERLRKMTAAAPEEKAEPAPEEKAADAPEPIAEEKAEAVEEKTE